MADRFSCALASAAAGEPLYATASQVRRWILVEQPGPWGVDAVLRSGLPLEIATRLRAIARAQRARLLLVRRHGRSVPSRRSCLVVVSTADIRFVERFTFDDPGELLEIDWAPLRLLEPVGGEPVTEPQYLVCTNGSHDTDCARFGRPVAAALDAAFPAQVWEASHYGGDRFAGNLVFLPQGIYYGRVDPADAAGLVDLMRAGELSMDHYRGRSCEPFVAQAGEHFARVERGLTGVDDVVPESVVDLGGGTFAVVVTTVGGQRVTATVAVENAETPQQLTCRATALEHPPRYRLLSLA